MTKILKQRMIDLLGGYPAWATDDLIKDKIEVLAARLFDLGEQYQGNMIDARRSNKAIPMFIGELMDALNSECSKTLRPKIETYHLSPKKQKKDDVQNKSTSLIDAARKALDPDITTKSEDDKKEDDSEFLRLLKLADKIRKGNDVLKELTLDVRNINLSKKGNKSKYRKPPPDYQSIVDDANKIALKNPNLSTSAIAEILAKTHTKYLAGRIRNILTPLKK